MTYHPIDKPTEPGWYWWRPPGRNMFWPELIEVVGGRLMQYDSRDGGHEEISDGTWFGPKIELPDQKPEMPRPPKRFRWRNTLSITSVTYGFGLYFREADEYVVLLGNGTMKVCKHSPHKYEIFEWLDTELEKTRDDGDDGSGKYVPQGCLACGGVVLRTDATKEYKGVLYHAACNPHGD